MKSCSTCCEPLPSWVSEMKSISKIKAFSDMERINHARFRPTFCKTLQPDTDRDIKIRTPVLAFHPDCIFSKTSSICVCFVFLTSFTDVFSDFLVALKSQLNVPLRVFIVNKQMHVYFLNTLIVCGALSHNKCGEHISLLITLLQSWFFLGWSTPAEFIFLKTKKTECVHLLISFWYAVIENNTKTNVSIDV